MGQAYEPGLCSARHPRCSTRGPGNRYMRRRGRLQLRRARFSPRILLLSAHASDETFALARDLGAFACLRKPFDERIRGTILGALEVAE